MEHHAVRAVTFRPEIQGLRAVAVLAVLLFHVWPSRVGGGYVGVDVFFVISGYLITGLLLKELERTGTISLRDFYSRRIRRLLPAATLVIVVAAPLISILPAVQWSDTAMEMLASTFYVQNWWLAAQAVDYLAEDNAPGLLQHYWSLSVEEQYYLFWPLLFLLATACRRPLRDKPRLVFGTLIISIGVASFIHSVYLTSANPGLAYFATTTRAWELGLGGAFAVLGRGCDRIPVFARSLLGWVGLICILLACVLYDGNTAFPGYAAVLPTVGAVLVIAAGQPRSGWGVDRLLQLRPVQYLGDISYSLYLWHWVVIVVLKGLWSSALGWGEGIVAIVLSIVLAHITKVVVEDPIRTGKWRNYNFNVNPVLVASTSTAIVLLAANTIFVYIDRVSRAPAQTITADILHGKFDPSKPTIPPVLEARKDNPDVYRLKCHVDQVSSEPKKCEFGPAQAKYTLVLAGDSHAAQWLPTLQALYANRRDWKIITYTKSACSFTAARVQIGKKGEYVSCTEWNKNVMEELSKLKPTILVTSQSSGHRVGGLSRDESQQALAEGLLTRWREVAKLGTKVAVIRDTPWMAHNVPECMSAPDASVEKCSTKTEQAFQTDSIMLAMKRQPDVLFFDLSNIICETNMCAPVKGQVLIWRDRHHLTATFARLLAPEFNALLAVAP